VADSQKIAGLARRAVLETIVSKFTAAASHRSRRGSWQFEKPAIRPGFFLGWHCSPSIHQPLVNKISSFAYGGLDPRVRRRFVKPTWID
jgi:hypothetical protein